MLQSPVTVISVLALLALPLQAAAGLPLGQVTDFTSPGGVREQCIALSPMPGGIYSTADHQQEQRYCGIDLYNGNTALCPKIWSTSPGAMIYDLSTSS